MKLIETNGEDKNFIMLCQMLDDNLNELVGGEKQRQQYKQYNLLKDIRNVFLLYDNETPIGCASFKKYSDDIAEVKRVFVKKEYREKGFSKLLMETLEAKAIEKGFHSLILETGIVLTAAQGLYQKLGFHIIDNYGQYADMKESVCMQKAI